MSALSAIYRGRTIKDVYLASLLYDGIEDVSYSAVLYFLKEKRADPNLVLPKKGISPFHLVIGNDSLDFAIDVTEVILRHGGDPNVRSRDGYTPLHIAAAWGRIAIVKLLLENGGDPELSDYDGKTPFDYACDENHKDICELFKKHLFQLSLNESCIMNLDNNKQKIEVTSESLPLENTHENLCCDNEPVTPVHQMIGSYDSLRVTEEYCSSDDSFNKRFGFANVKRSSYKKDICSISTSFGLDSMSIESGIVTLPENSPDKNELHNKSKDASSDYFTCGADSPTLFEKNIFEVTNDISNENVYEITSDFSSSYESHDTHNSVDKNIASEDLSFVTVSDVYKYTDEEKGVVFFEEHLHKNTTRESNTSVSSEGKCTSCSSETLRTQLTLHGFNPGPITTSTKRIYLKKLKRLKENKSLNLPQPSNESASKKAYSVELEKCIRDFGWTKNLTSYRLLEESLLQFNSPNPDKKWREGVTKSSFTYLLLDSRITNNLPCRAELLQPKEVWEIFLSAIFYVGKGKRSRPYSHLYDALKIWQGKETANNKKLKRIIDIWNDNRGVVCLHLFQNVIPEEAYTREAAMIKALNVNNLENLKGSNFYGITKTWTSKQQKMLGVYLLYKAMLIFLNEGERQIHPVDIDCN